MYDITAIGELLIDFTPDGVSALGMPVFAQNPGGAPANVLVYASHCGLQTAMIGKVGGDGFGKFLIRILQEHRVDTKGLIIDPSVETTLAFVHLSPDGDRDFSFYRTKGADKFLVPSDIDQRIIDESRIIHFGSLSLTDEPSRATTLQALDYARSKNKIISYDPNWRPPLWSSQDEGAVWMKKGLSYADIAKMSEEELAILSGEVGLATGIHVIFEQNPLLKLLAVTLGKDGCIIATNRRSHHAAGMTELNPRESRHIAGVAKINGKPLAAVDATGAGDCFTGALLTCILKNGVSLEDAAIDELAEYARYANHAAALCVTKQGGIPSIPAEEEVLDCLACAD